MYSKVTFLLVLLFMLACYPPPEFPNEPVIWLERINLTDEAEIEFTFGIRDGDGDVGLSTEMDDPNSANQEDFLPPYHEYEILVTEDTVPVRPNSIGAGNFYKVPISRSDIPVCLSKFTENAAPNCRRIDGIAGYIDYVPDLIYAGERVFFSSQDPRPSEYNCEDYQIIDIYDVVSEEIIIEGEQGTFLNQNIERVAQDTVMVVRNDNFYNLYLEIYVNQNGQDVPIADVLGTTNSCDPIYNARLPVFNRSDFGRPIEGSITYKLFSVLFQNPEILNLEIKFQLWILDRALNQSNIEETPYFKILDLRERDLVF